MTEADLPGVADEQVQPDAQMPFKPARIAIS
jgi:hypothetical protein